jgi:hypothetical protein
MNDCLGDAEFASGRSKRRPALEEPDRPVWVGTASSRRTEAVIGLASPASTRPDGGCKPHCSRSDQDGGRGERQLDGCERECTDRQRAAPHAAELPYKSPLKLGRASLAYRSGAATASWEPQASRLRLCLVSTVPFGPARRLEFSTSRTYGAESPRRIARLFAGCCLRLFLVRTVMRKGAVPDTILPS